MTLRKAKVSDASSIAAISIEVWIGTYLKQGVRAFFADYALAEFTRSNTQALIENDAHWIMVSENEDGIDGFVRLTNKSPAPDGTGSSDLEIATLYVQPRHHGKGIGKRLLSAAIEQVKRAGASSVWLTTNAENTPAIRFYLANGFKHAGETHFRIEDQAYLNNVYVFTFD